MRNYEIRRAEPADLNDILKIYALARSYMRENGNPNQWGDGYPSSEMLLEDIFNKRLYAVTDRGVIRGVFYFEIGDDPTYARIEGGWISDEPYGVIHRIASDGSGGIFRACLDFCLRRIPHLRIDTHHDNRTMQHVVEKHGFQRRGIIYVADGSPRIAYERI